MRRRICRSPPHFPASNAPRAEAPQRSDAGLQGIVSVCRNDFYHNHDSDAEDADLAVWEHFLPTIRNRGFPYPIGLQHMLDLAMLSFNSRIERMTVSRSDSFM